MYPSGQSNGSDFSERRRIQLTNTDDVCATRVTDNLFFHRGDAERGQISPEDSNFSIDL